MIFGRKNRAAHVADVAESVDAEPVDEREESEELAPEPDEAVAEAAVEDDLDEDAGDLDEDEMDAAEDELDAAEEPDEDGEDGDDPRADGPFDASEVDLSDDQVARIPLGPLTITPFEGMGLQFQGDPESNTIYSALVMHENSGLQLELFAAPTSGGLAAELREDTLEEAQQAGGNAEVSEGPFGQEVKRVLPMEGPEGEQLFHVSRLWLVDGPRWVLRGTLMGQAAVAEGEEPPADVFVEFFRNIVVHRDDSPRVPGELLTLTLPELPSTDAGAEA